MLLTEGSRPTNQERRRHPIVVSHASREKENKLSIKSFWSSQLERSWLANVLECSLNYICFLY
jgi:hypothetical protein